MLLCMVATIAAWAQTVITGTVVSAADGEPLIGASVKVKGEKTVAVTDLNGKFKINAEAGQTLVFSYIAMETMERAAKKGMYVEMVSMEKTMDEVMVVAFGTATKSAFTGSAKVVSSEELAKSQVTNVTSALAGTVPGLTLTSSNGAPDGTPTIRIRGFGSLNAGKDPLIILDGAPFSGDINTLNPSDVESMTVLKDAASSALYGARGANGVIIITTKQAKKGQDAVFSFDAKVGGNMRALQHYDVVKNPAQYYEMQYDALKNFYMNSKGYDQNQAWLAANSIITGAPDEGGLGYNIWTIPTGQYLIGRNGRINPNATLGYVNGDYFITPDDWEKVGTRNGIRQDYNVSVNGSTERSNFYMSLGYLSNEGITEKSDFKRLTARLRADYQAKDWLRVGGNLSYARYDANSLGNNGSSSSTGNIWAFTSQMAPIYPAYVRNADGSIKIDENGFKVMDYGNGMNAGYDRPFIQDANPIMDVLLNTRNYEGNASVGSGFADFIFMPGLTFTLKGSYDFDEARGTYVYNKYYGQFDTTGGTVQKYHSRNFSYNLQQLLNYTTTIKNKHNLNVMLGHEYYDSKYSYLSASKSNMFSDDNDELAGAVIDGKSAYSYTSRYNNEGWFARAQYDYDQRIFASASYRYDASSRFSEENRWGSFWSLGGAWIMSKENWFKPSWVDMLKVKASVGSQGNDNIGNYRYTDQYVISNSNGNVGTSFDSKGNKDITWETQTNFNAGVEFGLFKRLTGSIEYYYRQTSDMLMQFTTAPSIGYTSYWANIGDMYNTGVEFDLQYNIIKNKNVDWKVNLNISSIKNRISKLDPEHKNSSCYTADGRKIDGYVDGSFFIAEDQSIYTWRLKDYAGVDPQTGEALWYKNTFKTDANGNKVWTGRETTNQYAEADYYVTEKTTVPNWQGGLGSSIKLYGFDISFNCSFQFGGTGYDGTYAQFMAPPTNSNGGYNFHKDLLNSWSPENPNSDIPRFQYDDLYPSSSSTRFLTSSSYFNIDNINIGYTLPKSLTQKFKVSNLRLYLACENVAYFSSRKGFDPRQSYSGSSNATTYSPMRTISGGLTVQF